MINTRISHLYTCSLWSIGLHWCRYDFVPPVKYDYLDAEEAEKKFEQRHKTLNYFSVMLSRRLREEEGEGGGEGGEVAAGGKKKNAKRKDVGNLVRTYTCACAI